MGTRARDWGWAGVTLGLALGWAGAVLAGVLAAGVVRAEPTYRYTTDDGRPAFTNVRSLAPSTADLTELDLPALIHLDPAQANAAELARINERLERAHRQLTQSPACQAAIEDGLVPWHQRLWRSQPHWIGVAGILVFVALVSRFFRHSLPPGMWSRTLTFLLPMLLGVGIVGSVGARMASTLRAVRFEAQACGSELEPARGDDPEVVRRRAGTLGTIQQALQQRERRMQQRADALAKEYQI